MNKLDDSKATPRVLLGCAAIWLSGLALAGLVLLLLDGCGEAPEPEMPDYLIEAPETDRTHCPSPPEPPKCPDVRVVVEPEVCPEAEPPEVELVPWDCGWCELVQSPDGNHWAEWVPCEPTVETGIGFHTLTTFCPPEEQCLTDIELLECVTDLCILK